MLRVGLTGGIGSGKTTVAKIFEVLGIPVYYADDAAKRLMNEDASLKQLIKQKFGEQSYIDENLNRSFLAKAVFSDPVKLGILNGLVHPVTIADAEKWMISQNTYYAIKEAALIFESNAHKRLDLVIGVLSPLKLRIERAMKRDHLTEEDVGARISMQMDEDKKMALCNFLINNDETELLIPQVISIHEVLLKKANMLKS